MTRAEFFQVAQEVREEDLDRAAEILRAINAHDRLAIQLALAEEVEPEPDEIAMLAEVTEEDIRNARPLDEVCAELGLQ